MVSSEFPSNSQSQKRAERTPKKNINRVTESAAIRRKTPLGKRFSKMFVGGDARSVWVYMVFDVLIPAGRDAMVDAFTGGIERLILGENTYGGSRRSRRHRSEGMYTNYSRFSSGGPPKDPREQRGQQMSRRARAKFDFDEIILPHRGEAEEVIDQMFEILSKFETVTVADLYALVDIESNSVEEKWGWENLEGAGVSRVAGGGYLLDLPRPEHLD